MSKPAEPQPEKSQEGTPTTPPVRTISPEQLREILEAHRKWVETNEKEGTQTVLWGTNLQGANLVNANLQLAILTNTNLQEANLYQANLQEANLINANLQGAILRKATLQGADLPNVLGLTQEQLDEACGDAETRLPSGLKVDPCRGSPPRTTEGR